jgi:hypothetical protein
MEHSSHNSALRQKLDQHNFGYKPGAWENFDHLLQSNPIAAPKKSFWDYKKWFGAGAAAMVVVGSILFLNTSNENTAAVPTKQLDVSSKTEIPVLETKEDNKSVSVNKKNTKSDIVPAPVMQTMSPNVTTKSAAHLSQHDDSVLPHEAEVKVRASQPYQRISKSASDESAVFPSSHKTEDHHVVKKNQELLNNSVPDAHELDAAVPKTGKKN